jgi:addiction module RelE/StbE family toxin
MRVRYTATALRELDDIFAYVAKNSVTGASSVAGRVEQLIGQLAEFPYMAQETDFVGVRKFPLGRFPYFVYYVVEEDEVVIVHIRHQVRRPLTAEEL